MNKALEAYWWKYKVMMGFDPDGPMTWEEKFHWRKVDRVRQQCINSTDPFFAIHTAPFFDKQYFLEKWWDKLTEDDKVNLLGHVWLNKGDAILYGYDWWLPYFEEFTFITNCDADIPEKPVTLYRGIEKEFVLGMSWTNKITTADTFALNGLVEKKVYKTVVQPENILAILEGTVSHDLNNVSVITEYVVNHRKLKLEDIQEVGEWDTV